MKALLNPMLPGYFPIILWNCRIVTRMISHELKQEHFGLNGYLNFFFSSGIQIIFDLSTGVKNCGFNIGRLP